VSYTGAETAKRRAGINKDRIRRHQVLRNVDRKFGTVDLHQGHLAESLPQRFRRRAAAREAYVPAAVGGNPVLEHVGLPMYLDPPRSEYPEEFVRGV